MKDEVRVGGWRPYAPQTVLAQVRASPITVDTVPILARNCVRLRNWRAPIEKAIAFLFLVSRMEAMRTYDISVVRTIIARAS